jgi:hypothetical protein
MSDTCASVRIPRYDDDGPTCYWIVKTGDALRMESANGNIAVYRVQLGQDARYIQLGNKLWRVSELAAYLYDSDLVVTVEDGNRYWPSI